MKISFVVHTAHPDFIGGREIHVHNLARALAKRHEVTVFGGARTKKVQVEESMGYRLVKMPVYSLCVSRSPLQYYRISPDLPKLLRSCGADIIHAFEYGSYSTGIAGDYAKRTLCPFFLTVYGYQLTRPLARIAKKIYDKIYGKSILAAAENIFCVSEIQREEIYRIALGLNPRKITVSPNTILLSDFDDGDAKVQNDPWRGPLGSVRILSVMRLLPRKNPDVLLKAISVLVHKKGIKNIECCILGPDSGSLEAVNRGIETMKLSEWVYLAGPMGHREVRGFLQTSDIFVLPSSYEGLPLSMLEAMSCGKSIVCSDLPGICSVVIHRVNGLLAQPHDLDSWVGALYELVTNPLLRKDLGEKARIAVEALDSRKEAESLLMAYEGAIFRYNRIGQ